MTVSTDGLLAYGTDLINADGSWSVPEWDEDSADLATSWWGAKALDGYGEEVTGHEKALLILYGRIPGTPEVAPAGAWMWAEAVAEYWGVRFVQCGASSNPHYLLAAWHEECRRNDAVEIKIPDAEQRAAWDAKLVEAYMALGLEPPEHGEFLLSVYVESM